MKNLKYIINTALVAVFILSSVSFSIARESARRSSGPLRKTTGTPISTLVNVNNLSMWARADGWSARNPATGGSGVLFPRGNPSGIIFADGLVWTGLVQDGQLPVLRGGGQTYAIGTVPGRIISKGVAEDPSADDVRIWRVRRDFHKADLRQDAADFLDVAVSNITSADEEAIRNQYRIDWEEWPGHKGAPFYDSNGDGIYTPAFASDNIEPILFPDADEPGIADADQVVWFVANDLADGAVRGLYGSPSMGLEMQATFWAYARTDPLGFVIFKRYKLIYTGTSDTPDGATIDSMYISQWSDPDLGSFGDDYVGTDPATSMMYVYNSSAVDNAYRNAGLPPPAAGYDFFAGPLVSVACATDDVAACLAAGGTYMDVNTNGTFDPGTDTAIDTAIFDLKKKAGFRNLGASSMAYFAAGTAFSDPPLGTYEGTTQWRNLHFGLAPATGANYPSFDACGLFVFCGDPVTGVGDIDTGPADRRMLMTTGPFTMALGDTQEVTVALLAAFGADNLSAISVLRFYDISAQAAFDALFDLAKAPLSPALTLSGIVPNPEKIREETVKIVINWGSRPDEVTITEGAVAQGYAFEGYNVYQLPTANATFSEAKILATFDVVNEVTTILDPQFDEKSGQILLLPSQLGTNSGIERFLTVETDAFSDGGPFIMGSTYHFAVTAYSYNGSDEVAIHALESVLLINSVTPAGPAPGQRLIGAAGDTIQPVLHVTGGSDGSAIPLIVDPTSTTGDSYEVTFVEVDGVTMWSLTNSTTNTVLVADATNLSGDGKYSIIEGLQVKVTGPPPGMKDWDIPNGTRRFTWAGGADGFGFEGFNGAIGWGSPSWAFGSGIQGVSAPNITNVLLKLANASDTGDFTPPTFDASQENVSFAYRYGRNFAVAAEQPQFAPFIINTAGTGYDYQDFTKSVPLSAWDMESDPPRRLALGFLENNQPADGAGGGGMVDGVWWPPAHTTGNNTAGSGPREWLWIFNTDYSETPNPAYQVEAIGSEAPIMWWLLVARRGQEVDFEDGDEFLILANHVNSPADKFTFTSQTATGEAEQAKADISLINVFPNPYIGINSLETNTFERFVRFTHMPPKAKIRIFNIAGVHVRTLDKNDATTQFFDWDLLNKNRLPVASGIYIAYLSDLKAADGTDMGTKVIKIAIVQERQFLQNF